MPHYFDRQEGPLREQKVSFSVRDRLFSAVAGSGTFSKDGLDNASRLLIESCDLSGSEKLLDLGCGWGPVGLVLKSCFPSIALTMVDSNDHAVLLARKNMDKAKLDADVLRSDIFSKIPDATFDVILTNPPYAAGRKVCYAFIEESYEHLEKDGVFLLVARHQKGGKMLEQKIEETFGTVETIAKQGGFRVYKGIKN